MEPCIVNSVDQRDLLEKKRRSFQRVYSPRKPKVMAGGTRVFVHVDIDRSLILKDLTQIRVENVRYYDKIRGS